MFQEEGEKVMERRKDDNSDNISHILSVSLFLFHLIKKGVYSRKVNPN